MCIMYIVHNTHTYIHYTTKTFLLYIILEMYIFKSNGYGVFAAEELKYANNV